MKLESFLHFIIAHNETIILATIGLVCALAAVVFFRQVFGPQPVAVDGADFSKIEETLKKLLSQTNGAIQTVAAAAPAPSGTAAAGSAAFASGGVDVSGLERELKERAVIIEELKKQVEAAKAADQGSSNELLAKIKTLEGKLAEYEIIEDDIADLSHYKDENARLKKELEQFKRGGPELVDQFAAAVDSSTGATAAAPSAAAKAAVPPASIEDVVQAVQTAAPAGAVAGNAEIGETIEFENDGVKVTPPPATPAVADVEAKLAEAQSAIKSTVVAEPTNVPTMKDAKKDIFAEFSGEQKENEDPLAALGEIDTNRMLEELKDLNIDLQAGVETLDEAPNIDKMAEEAVKLNKKNG